MFIGKERMCCRFKEKKKQNENYTLKEKDIRFDRNKKKLNEKKNRMKNCNYI